MVQRPICGTFCTSRRPRGIAPSSCRSQAGGRVGSSDLRRTADVELQARCRARRLPPMRNVSTSRRRCDAGARRGYRAPAWRVAGRERVTAPTLAHGGWVIAAAARQLLALRASDGAIVWRKPVGTIEFRPAIDGDLLFVSVTEGRLLALNLRGRRERWAVALDSEPTEPFVIGRPGLRRRGRRIRFDVHANVRSAGAIRRRSRRRR